MHHWQQPFLGLREFPLELTAFEVEYFFSFSPQERKAVESRRGAHHRLGAVIHLGFIRMTGRALDALDRIPAQVLIHVGEQLDIQAPELSTLRALYGRGRTLFEHQVWAAKTLGFRPFNDHRQRVLTTQLKREAQKGGTVNQLARFAKRWLYDTRILIPGAKRLKGIVAQASRDTEHDLFARIEKTIPQAVRTKWYNAVGEKRTGRETVLEWLQKPPGARSDKTLNAQLKKLAWLKEIGVDTYTPDEIRLERQRAYAQRIRQRPPTRLRYLREPRRTLELVCFLRVTLLQVTDVIVTLADMKVQDIRREAIRKVKALNVQSLRESKEVFRVIRDMLEDTTLSDAEVRGKLLELLPAESVLIQSRAALVRWRLSEDGRPVRKLLKKLLGLEFESNNSALLAALEYLKAVYHGRRRTLSEAVDIGFAPVWHDLLQGCDRARALRAFEAATLVEMRKALRNGSLWVASSLSYRKRDQMLISANQWRANKERYYEHLAVPTQPGSYMRRLRANVEVGLSAVAKALDDGEISIDDDGLHLKALEAEDAPPLVSSTRREIFAEIGTVQFPDLIVAVDTQTRFSWTLLGRESASENELLTLYGALLAHGTAADAARVSLMISGLSETAITEAMRMLENETTLRRANDVVVEFMYRHAVVKHWGKGTMASSDSMSLDVSRHLWNARVDPRRCHLGIGMYTHVLDKWGIIHRLFNVANWIQDGTFVMVSFIILCFSYPFYFLFDRGNIDGFVLLLMCFGVYCLRKWNAIAGVAFALAIASKVYPVLLILPLVSWRRWRALVFLGLSLGLLFLLSPQLWQAFFEERLSTRTAWFRLDENASLANTLFYIGDLFNQGELLRDHHLYVFGTLLFLASCADFTRTCHFEQRECYASMLMYLPFMVAVPQLAYHYELICVLPIIAVISWLWQKSEQGAEKILLGLAAVGIALSQFQAVAAEKLLGAVAPHFLPGFGLFLVMVCVTLHKVVFSANLLSKGLQMLILPRRKVIARGTQNMTLK